MLSYFNIRHPIRPSNLTATNTGPLQEFKESDEQMLRDTSPPGSSFIWFGNPRTSGIGSVVSLMQAIKSGRVNYGEEQRV